jgi:(p)ppGpp synthase/HD superfamily hydrolase
MISQLEKAIQLAVEAHLGQRDKSGEPYILHPLYVMFQMYTTEEKIVAVLHDVIEDTSWDMGDIMDEMICIYKDNIYNALVAITRNDGEKYFDYIRRVKKNNLATLIKKADLEHNICRSDNLPDSLTERYFKSLEILQEKPNE